jgi:hypothetical protein
MAAIERIEARRAIGLYRLAVGAGAWLVPRLGTRMFTLDPAGNPESPFLARLFGARDVALAFGTMSATDPARRSWVAAGFACDVADALAALLGARAGYLSRTQTGVLVTAALVAAALGAAALREGEGPDLRQSAAGSTPTRRA